MAQQNRNASLGDYLFSVRQAKKWTLREAAKLIGIAYSRLGEIEKGIDGHSGKRFTPSYIHLVKIGQAYELSVAQLLRMGGYQPGMELAPDEWRLVEDYRSLAEAQREGLWKALTALKNGLESAHDEISAATPTTQIDAKT